jgi:hypothetical protein
MGARTFTHAPALPLVQQCAHSARPVFSSNQAISRSASRQCDKYPEEKSVLAMSLRRSASVSAEVSSVRQSAPAEQGRGRASWQIVPHCRGSSMACPKNRPGSGQDEVTTRHLRPCRRLAETHRLHLLHQTRVQVEQLGSLGFRDTQLFTREGREIVSEADMADERDWMLHDYCRI